MISPKTFVIIIMISMIALLVIVPNIIWFIPQEPDKEKVMVVTDKGFGDHFGFWVDVANHGLTERETYYINFNEGPRKLSELETGHLYRFRLSQDYYIDPYTWQWAGGDPVKQFIGSREWRIVNVTEVK